MKTKKVNKKLNSCFYVPEAFYSENQDPDKLISELKNSDFKKLIIGCFI